MQDHRQLEVWQRAMTYTGRTYEFSADLPKDERYNLTEQLRRAAMSVPLNIAEGAAAISTRNSSASWAAYRPLKEVDTCLELCRRIYHTLPTGVGVTGLMEEGDQIARMVHALSRRISADRSTKPPRPRQQERA